MMYLNNLTICFVDKLLKLYIQVVEKSILEGENQSLQVKLEDTADSGAQSQLCEYFGRNRSAFSFHMRKCPYDCIEQADHLPDTGDEPTLSCQRCRVKFESTDLLRAHNNSQHKCKKCDFMGCSKSETKLHVIQKHKSVPPKRDRSKKAKENTFKCAVCQWSSSHVTRVLLHLIHHPDQAVDEKLFDLTILRKHGIVR